MTAPTAESAPGPTAGAERLVRVVPDVPALRRTFDYRVPPQLDDRLTVGHRVRVELHGRRVSGWVVDDHVAATPGVDPKPLLSSSGLGPPDPLVRLAEWAAWRWAGPVSSFLATASPERVVRALPPPPAAVRPPSPGGGAVDLVEAALGPGHRSVLRLPPALDALLVVEEVLHRTGPSGLLVLTPSRRRAGAVEARLRGLGVPVATLPREWDRAAAGGAVVVGTRTAAWAPVLKLRAAVVLDAHDDAYREQRSPTWSAVEVVRERAGRDGAALLLVSACPTVVLLEGASLVTTPRPLERRGWPVVEVVDRRRDDPRTGLFSERLHRAVREVLARPEGRVVCVLNRTGRQLLLACRACGALAHCTRCGAAAALVREEDGAAAVADGAAEALACRRCGERRPVICATCDATRFRALRLGVTRAAEELSALVGTGAVSVTAETGAEDATPARLVVGTDAAFHRLSHADLVCVLDLDQHLLAPRFGAAEEGLALLARAARLLGTRERGGRLLVQTRLPDHDAVRAAARADPGVLAASERDLRSCLGLPPFGALATLSGPGAAEMAEALAAYPGIEASRAGHDAGRRAPSERWLVRAPGHAPLCDALAAVPRPAERARVAVDPVDV